MNFFAKITACFLFILQVTPLQAMKAWNRRADLELAELIEKFEIDRHEPVDPEMADLSDDDDFLALSNRSLNKYSFQWVAHLHQMRNGRVKDDLQKLPPSYKKCELIQEFLSTLDPGSLQDPESLVLAINDPKLIKSLLSVSNFSFNSTRLILPQDREFIQLLPPVRHPELQASRFRKWTLLHLVVLAEKVELLRLLDHFFQANLDSRGSYELDVNCKTNYFPSFFANTPTEGATPLHLAVIGGSTVFVEWLLKHGADPHIAHRHGDTPLLLAKGLNYFEESGPYSDVVAVLERYLV